VSEAERIVIVGGSDAGVMAGLRARELDPDADVTLVVSDAYPNFSICGIPYHVSGEVPDWRALAHRTRDDLEAAGLRLRLDERAAAIDPGRRTLTTERGDGRHEIAYDRLIIGTGAVPQRPPIAGLDALGPDHGVHLLHTMGDTFALTRGMAERGARSAVIVGAGYIGVEMAEALRHRGLAVTVLERLDQVLPRTLDAGPAALVRTELERNGVEVACGVAVTSIAEKDDRLMVAADDGATRYADVVLVVTGVRPDTELAASAGVKLGAAGAIAVDERMRTNVPDVYAAGDCVHTHHRLLDTPTYLPLGTTAHKQGRVAGANAVSDGHGTTFAGVLGTQVVRVFDLVVAATGLRGSEAAAAGYKPLTVDSEPDDHKRYYPGATPIRIRVTGDTRTGRLLGAQLVGSLGAEIAKRVDTYATAITYGARVTDIADLDLSYTPPLGSPFDAVQVAAQAWDKQHASDQAPADNGS
jgi:NADPH-dependent 2,4-dienoyl-CoA reductase/sulfur reductase-like enzyme